MSTSATQTWPGTGLRAARTIVPWPTLVACVAALALTAHVALSTTGGQLRDERAMRSLYAGGTSRRTLLGWLGDISIGSTAVVLTACVAVALLRGRVRHAAAAAIVVAGANVTTQVLKSSVLTRDALGGSTSNSLPSGHTTVVASCVVAALIVVPAALRVLTVVLGSAAVMMTGASTVVAGWHRPSDILAALLVTVAWGALAVGLLDLRLASRGLSALAGGAAAAVAAGVGLALAGVRPIEGWAGLPEATATLAFLAGVTTLALAAFARLGTRD